MLWVGSHSQLDSQGTNPFSGYVYLSVVFLFPLFLFFFFLFGATCKFWCLLRESLDAGTVYIVWGIYRAWFNVDPTKRSQSGGRSLPRRESRDNTLCNELNEKIYQAHSDREKFRSGDKIPGKQDISLILGQKHSIACYLTKTKIFSILI